MSRKDEMEQLGGTRSEPTDEATVIKEAFETWRARGQIPPLVEELMARTEAAVDSVALFDRLVQHLHSEVVRQINTVERIPITLRELRLGPDLTGVAVMDERHICLSEFAATIDFAADGAPLSWSTLPSTEKHYTFHLAEVFDRQTLGELQAALAHPEPTLFSAYHLRAGEAYLALGDDFPWRDPYFDPREKYRRALPHLEKAAALVPDDPEITSQVRRVQQLAGVAEHP